MIDRTNYIAGRFAQYLGEITGIATVAWSQNTLSILGGIALYLSARNFGSEVMSDIRDQLNKNNLESQLENKSPGVKL